ncbi:MAG: EamA family transporter [Flavobacteriales bacterium]|nr:EamA family transporter [Flavobacteriales bacterium]MDW8410123.1 EamA family transporter [Flavobacteriales bacterium]
MSRGQAYILLSVFFFSLMNVCVKMVAHLPVHEVILARSLVSLVACLIPLWRLGINPLGKERRFLLMRGLAGFGSLSLYFFTLQRIPLATAVTLQYLAPLFTAVLSWKLLGEKVSYPRWGAFFVSLTGVAVATNFDPRTSWTFALLGVASALLAALAYYSISKAKDSEHPLVIVLYFPLVAIPVTGLLCLRQFRWPSGADWLWLLLTGIFTQTAQVFMTRGYMEEKIGRAAGLKYSGVLFALLWGFIIFHDTYHPGQIAGIIILILGTLGHIFFK